MFYQNFKFIDNNKNHLSKYKLKHSVNIIKLNLNKQKSETNNFSWNYNNSRYLLQTPQFEIPFIEQLEQKKKYSSQYLYNHGNKLAYHKKKNLFDDNPQKCNEEKPIFNIDNQKNLKHYQNMINGIKNKIERNEQDYLGYINAFENIPNNYYHNNYSNNFITERKKENLPIINRNYNNKKLNISNSANNINESKYKYFVGRTREITNPELFYKKVNGDFYKYRAENKKYLDYNYNIMGRRNLKNINVNPFNKGSSLDLLGRSTLIHNTILNPIPNFSYNKYFEKEILGLKNNYKLPKI